MDSEGPTDDEATAEGDSNEEYSNEEYTFNTGTQEPQTAKPIFQVKIMDTLIQGQQ